MDIYVTKQVRDDQSTDHESKQDNRKFLVHKGHLFEVTSDKKMVWDFENPIFKGESKVVTYDEKDGSPIDHEISSNIVHRAYKYKGRTLSPKGYIGGDDCPVFFHNIQ